AHGAREAQESLVGSRSSIGGRSALGTGCSAAWLAHLTGGQGVAGSNPAIPTTFPHRELPHDCRLDVCVGRTSSITSAADSFVRRNVKTLCESLPERRSIAARDALRLRE